MIKKILEILAKRIGNSGFLLKVFSPMLYFSNHILLHKRLNEPPVENPLHNKITRILGEPVVKHGPFQGMKYPSYTSVGSTIFPKIIGCYEAELHSTIENMIAQNFDFVYDIGCAEGYYAIGFALRNAHASIFAYDINDTAKKLCTEMSVLNNVQQHVSVKSEFNKSTFAEIPASKKVLIICDCEGYEAALFNEDILPYLHNTTLLIETHDFIDPLISIRLTSLLEKTHTIQVIQSMDDILKAKYYNYPELTALTIQEKKEVVKEMRPVIMEWIVATPKNNL